MLGFLIGTACLIGLIKVARRHRGGCWHGHGPGCGHGHGWHGHGWHGHGHGWRGWHGHDGHGWHGPRGGMFSRLRARGVSAWLYPLFARLDTTPGQEKVIRREVEGLRVALFETRGELFRGRGDIARTLRADSVDETALGELFARHDEHLTELRKQAVGALVNIHDALDEQQRERLAAMLESGPGCRDHGGPYRGEG